MKLNEQPRPYTLLIDADILAYRAAAAFQKEYDWDDDGDTTVSTDYDGAVDTVRGVMSEYIEDLEADNAIVCLTDSENWRYSIFPPYKAKRRNKPRPLLLRPVKDFLASEYQTYSRPTLEADDVMGILSTSAVLGYGTKIVVSQDKDLRTVPGWLYNPDKMKRPQYVTEWEAFKFHMYQTLIGDTTDEYPGCPGIGPKKAMKVIGDLGFEDIGAYAYVSLWTDVLSIYHEKGLTDEDALVQARVAKICTKHEYDFKRKQVKLWEPPR